MSSRGGSGRVLGAEKRRRSEKGRVAIGFGGAIGERRAESGELRWIFFFSWFFYPIPAHEEGVSMICGDERDLVVKSDTVDFRSDGWSVL